MVFKMKLFFSSKKSESSSPGRSSGHRSASNSLFRSEKKKTKSSASKESQPQPQPPEVTPAKPAASISEKPDAKPKPGGSDILTPEESESPRFQAIMRVASGTKSRLPDIKSFSHELNSKGVQSFPFHVPRCLNKLEEMIRAKFDQAKEEVNNDLAIFAADLAGILEKIPEVHPHWQETIEGLLILAWRCAMTPPAEFRLQCEGIVQELCDHRQQLPPGMLKQQYTTMHFILTRCNRLLQFHKESFYVKDEHM